MSAISLALSMILSKSEGMLSSSSGLHNICPICAKFKLAFAAFLSKVEVILKFLRHIGLNLKVFSRNLMSSSILRLLMYSSDFLENDSSA